MKDNVALDEAEENLIIKIMLKNVGFEEKNCIYRINKKMLL